MKYLTVLVLSVLLFAACSKKSHCFCATYVGLSITNGLHEVTPLCYRGDDKSNEWLTYTPEAIVGDTICNYKLK